MLNDDRVYTGEKEVIREESPQANNDYVNQAQPIQPTLSPLEYAYSEYFRRNEGATIVELAKYFQCPCYMYWQSEDIKSIVMFVLKTEHNGDMVSAAHKSALRLFNQPSNNVKVIQPVGYEVIGSYYAVRFMCRFESKMLSATEFVQAERGAGRMTKYSETQRLILSPITEAIKVHPLGAISPAHVYADGTNIDILYFPCMITNDDSKKRLDDAGALLEIGMNCLPAFTKSLTASDALKMIAQMAEFIESHNANGENGDIYADDGTAWYKKIFSLSSPDCETKSTRDNTVKQPSMTM